MTIKSCVFGWEKLKRIVVPGTWEELAYLALSRLTLQDWAKCQHSCKIQPAVMAFESCGFCVNRVQVRVRAVRFQDHTRWEFLSCPYEKAIFGAQDKGGEGRRKRTERKRPSSYSERNSWIGCITNNVCCLSLD
jgi:hypothetical protein